MERWQKTLLEEQRGKIFKEYIENIDFTQKETELLIINTFESLCKEIELPGMIYTSDEIGKKTLVAGDKKYYLKIEKNSIIVELQNKKQCTFTANRNGYSYNLGQDIVQQKPVNMNEKRIILFDEIKKQYQFNYKEILNVLLDVLVK